MRDGLKEVHWQSLVKLEKNAAATFGPENVSSPDSHVKRRQELQGSLRHGDPGTLAKEKPRTHETQQTKRRRHGLACREPHDRELQGPPEQRSTLLPLTVEDTQNHPGGERLRSFLWCAWRNVCVFGVGSAGWPDGPLQSRVAHGFTVVTQSITLLIPGT